MSVSRARAFGTVGIGAPWSAVRFPKGGLLRLYKFVDAISPFDFRRRPGSGPGDQPNDDEEARTSPWDDPALWLLMIH